MTNAKRTGSKKRESLQDKLGFKTEIRDLKEVRRNYRREVAEVEAAEGPQVPQQLVKRGRPTKGAAVERTEVQSFRVQPSVLKAVAAKAKAAGITTSAAIQLAVLEWSKR